MSNENDLSILSFDPFEGDFGDSESSLRIRKIGVDGKSGGPYKPGSRRRAGLASASETRRGDLRILAWLRSSKVPTGWSCVLCIVC